MKLIWISAALALLLPAQASAATWVYVTDSSQRTRYLVDIETIDRAGSLVTYWIKLDHSADSSVKHRETKLRRRADCANDTDILMNMIQYDADGSVIDSFTVPSYRQTPSAIVPDSVGESVHSFVCKK